MTDGFTEGRKGGGGGGHGYTLKINNLEHRILEF